MTILVTGGAGRLGRHVVNALVNRGERVRVLCKVPPKDETTKRLCEGAEIFIGDVQNMRSVTMALSGVDTVFHLAAVVNPYAKKDVLYSVNVSGSRNIFSACTDKKAKVVFCSSIAAMGNIAQNSNEDAACNPIDAYGKSKRDAELIMQSYFKRGLKGTIVRPGDIYGVGFAEGYEKVLRMLKDKKFVMPGDGNNHVPLINVDDATDGIIKAAEKMDEMPNETYLLVGPEKTLNYVIGTACELLKVDMPKRSVPIWLAKAFAWAKMKKADMEGVQTDITPHQVYILTQDRLFDVSKAKAKLGFEAKKELKQGIKEVIEWLKI